MSRDQLLQFHKDFCAQMHDICKAKNADYSGTTGVDPFFNLRMSVELGIVKSTELSILVRMMDKVSRLSKILNNPGGVGAVKEESVKDALLDLANYAVLMAAVRHTEPEPAKVGLPSVTNIDMRYPDPMAEAKFDPSEYTVVYSPNGPNPYYSAEYYRKPIVK